MPLAFSFTFAYLNKCYMGKSALWLRDAFVGRCPVKFELFFSRKWKHHPRKGSTDSPPGTANFAVFPSLIIVSLASLPEFQSEPDGEFARRLPAIRSGSSRLGSRATGSMSERN